VSASPRSSRPLDVHVHHIRDILMATVLIAVVAIATYVSPFALIYVWVIRLWDVDGRKDRRALWAWVSLGLVSLAVTVYWLTAFGFRRATSCYP
jgi:hypothetical protein